VLFYPKIPGSKDCPDGRCVAFEKLDGTNLHWDWDRDLGWHAFGTRRDVFNLTPDGLAQFTATHAHLHEAPDVFRATLAAGLDAVFRSQPFYVPFQMITVFKEFLGPNSFAGLHKADDPKQTVLLDVRAEGYGFVAPERFVEDFGHLPTPRVVYRGKLTGKFADEVRTGRHSVSEGVVCKGGTGGGDVWMVKIKTNAYLECLKQAFADRWEEYWE